MATEVERNILASVILPAVGRAAHRLSSSEITGFLAMAGHLYGGGLMVVGRAVNGWIPGILPNAITSSSVAESYADQVLASVARGTTCPMGWITESWGALPEKYNTKRSAYWRVIRAVVARLGIANVEEMTWPSHLVWSNLYKIAPAMGGNPGGLLRQVQLAGCIDLLRLELATYRPFRLLLLTGAAWATPFLGVIGRTLEPTPGSRYVEGFTTIQLIGGLQVQCVVAAHPQGSAESEWIKEVVEAYGH